MLRQWDLDVGQTHATSRLPVLVTTDGRRVAGFNLDERLVRRRIGRSGRAAPKLGVPRSIPQRLNRAASSEPEVAFPSP